MGEKEITSKYGIANVRQVIDLLGLMGDASDNIPGCPGVGEKTAVKLINEFGGIDNLLASTDQLKGAMKKKVEDNREKIILSKFLATIKTDVPIELNLDELRVKEQPDEERLRKIFDELEFKSFANRILNKHESKQKTANLQLDLFATNPPDGQEEQKSERFESLNTTPHKYELVDSEEKRRKLLDF